MLSKRNELKKTFSVKTENNYFLYMAHCQTRYRNATLAKEQDNDPSGILYFKTFVERLMRKVRLISFPVITAAPC